MSIHEHMSSIWWGFDSEGQKNKCSAVAVTSLTDISYVAENRNIGRMDQSCQNCYSGQGQKSERKHLRKWLGQRDKGIGL